MRRLELKHSLFGEVAHVECVVLKELLQAGVATVLGEAKLRGVVSSGMILAEDELAIGIDHAGILVLGEDHLTPGMPLAEVIPISTDVLVLEITPNRPDCLGIYGVAREVHAATGAPRDQMIPAGRLLDPIDRESEPLECIADRIADTTCDTGSGTLP